MTGKWSTAEDRASQRRVAASRTKDPLEERVEMALRGAAIEFHRDDAGSGLDFYLRGWDVYVEVKQFHTDRIAEQMSRRKNVIVIQGEAALQLFEQLLRDACR